MANWNGLVMTDKGIALQSKVQAGEVLNITKLKLGSGTLPEETDIRKLTDLIKPEQNLGIGGREPNGDYCKISATISNVGLEAGYYVRELGVFAQDPDDGEILYAYTTDGTPDYLPAEGGSTVISQEFSVNIAVSDTDKINVEIDPGALATMGYVQLQINEHNEDASAHEKAFSQHNTDETAHYDMTGATGSKAGKRGFAPAPKAGDQNKALFGNGQYQEVIVKTDIMVGATSSMAGKAGLVPTPAAGDQEKALFGDGTYKDIPLPEIAAISENTDLNTIIDRGEYFATGTVTSSLKNAPTTKAFFLEVKVYGDVIIQIAYEYGGSSNREPKIYERAMYNNGSSAGTWTSWHYLLQSYYDYVVETYTSGSSWYRKYASGWVVQGGNITSSSGSSGAKVVNLLVPMKDTNYSLMVTDNGDNSRNETMSGQKISTSTITINTDVIPYNVGWKVEGYAQ